MELIRQSLAPSERLRIVVLGYIVRGPLGGLVWHHLQYVLGLHLMGHEVLFLEDSDDYPSCYQPLTYEMSSDASYGLAFLQQTFASYDLADKWAYYDVHQQRWYGKSAQEVHVFLQQADCLLNLSGVNVLREAALLQIPHRALIDTDPAFTQIRHLSEPDAHSVAAQHNAFFTFGENYGLAYCHIPSDGFAWQATRQPVVLELWTPQPANPHRPWTTVMQWDSYQVREWAGISYGMKSASFTPYFEVPNLCTEKFELALGSASAPREHLLALGWHLIDPLSISQRAEDYQQYLTYSKGEWSVAKQGYVQSGSGWFSERSAAYLASGRPVVLQDTGFCRYLETGRGLMAFTSRSESLEAIQMVCADYALHCAAAREIAATYFEAAKVLGHLLERIFRAKGTI
jgi:hypothetical protein